MRTTSEPDTAVFASGVSKLFDNIRALDGLDFEAGFGELHAIIGANGSGKTTLLELIAGQLETSAGELITLGEIPSPPSRSLRASISYIAQKTALDPEMTGLETLALFCTLYGVAPGLHSGRIDRLVQQFGLGPVAGRRVAHYSGGFRQRLHLACGLVFDPRIVLVDEPTSMLDPPSRQQVWAALCDLAGQGTAVIVVTHDLDAARRHAHRTTLLARGKCLARGTPEELIARYGKTLLEVETESGFDPAATQAIAGVQTVIGRGRRAWVLLEQGVAPATVTAAIAGLRSYRYAEPSLTSAYLNLAGETLENEAVTGGPRRPGAIRS